MPISSGAGAWSYLTPKAEVLGSSVHGRGLFARAPIAAGGIVCVFGGDVIGEEAFRRIIAENPEAAQYGTKLAPGVYLITPNAGRELEDADFFNHSCNPNLGFRGAVTLVAMRDIREGEELAFDYAMCDDESDDSFLCSCGTPFCRGAVTGDDWRKPELQKRYRGCFSAHIASRIEEVGR